MHIRYFPTILDGLLGIVFYEHQRRLRWHPSKETSSDETPHSVQYSVTLPVVFVARQSDGALRYGASLRVPREHLEFRLIPEDIPEVGGGLRRQYSRNRV